MRRGCHCVVVSPGHYHWETINSPRSALVPLGFPARWSVCTPEEWEINIFWTLLSSVGSYWIILQGNLALLSVTMPLYSHVQPRWIYNIIVLDTCGIYWPRSCSKWGFNITSSPKQRPQKEGGRERERERERESAQQASVWGINGCICCFNPTNHLVELGNKQKRNGIDRYSWYHEPHQTHQTVRLHVNSNFGQVDDYLFINQHINADWKNGSKNVKWMNLGSASTSTLGRKTCSQGAPS